LWVEGDDLLLDRSAFSPSLRPKLLDLQNLSISATALTEIVRRCNETLQKVVMRGVYLEPGTWEEILLAMSELPLLVDCFIETCDYGRESAHYRPSVEPSENSSSCNPTYDFFIETNRSSDVNALGDVLVRIHKNKCRLHGDSYSTPAGLEGEAQMKDSKPRARLLRAYVRKGYCIEGSESEESEDDLENELFAFE
jgi:hypothetical protein